VNVDKIAKKIVGGAVDFVVWEEGSNAKSAFNRAYRDAQEEYGTRGYTGSLAEKDDYKIISEPLTSSEAKDFIERNIDKNPKYGPAYAIPVVGTMKGRTKPIKKRITVDGDSEDAKKAVWNMIIEKWKKPNLSISWEGAPTVKMVKQSKLLFSRENENFQMMYFFQIGSGRFSPVFKTRGAALKAAKQMAQDMGNKVDGKEMIIYSQKALDKFSISKMNDNIFQVEGNIKISRASKKVIGYYFFGMASY
jgi:hypothetical protein